MNDDELGCLYCNTFIDPSDIMGDSDWDKQMFDWYEDIECTNCDKRFKIRQYDVEVIRHFETKK